uniref:beta strand repeat-containing protein n=1 Tax=Frankia sp. Cas3 TaxID=3073926 RepID=UPI002AD465F1
MKRTSVFALLSLLAGTLLSGLGPAVSASAATPDVIDVVSVNGTTSGASAVSIMPMLSTGVTGTPIALPTAASGGNRPLTLSGSASSEGQLSLSSDGRYLTLAGYSASPGTGSVASTSSASVPRVVGRINGAGNVDTSTMLGTDAFTGNNVRAATTSDGSRFWITGANGGASTVKGGVVTAALGATTATSVSTTVSAGRVLNTAGGNLYFGTDKTTPTGVSRVGTGLPSTSGQSLSFLGGTADPYGFALVTVGGGAVPDTLYVADGTTGGLTKFFFNGSAWQSKGTVGGGTPLFGVAARVENGGVQIFATTLGGSKVDSVFDSSGAGGTFTGALTTIASAASGTSYRGIAFAPAGQPAPGPQPVLTLGDTVLGNVIGDADNPTLTVALSDPDSTVDVSTLAVTVATSNSAVAPLGNISVSGSGATRTVSVAPTGVGYSTITVTTTDPLGRTGTASFTYGASAPATDTTSHWLDGASDASTAIDVGGGYLLVGDDTSNVLRLYRGDRSGLPVKTWDIGSQLGLGTKGSDSMDVEAAARLGDTVYWTGSMGNASDDGALRPTRSTLFATRLSGSGATTDLTLVGSYSNLRADLIGWDQANGNPLGLADSAAAGHLPKTIDGFNVEGMEFAAGGSGTAYVGFRAPLETVSDRNLALVVPVTNLPTLVTGAGVAATFGSPMLWNLGGLSVRDIRRNADGQYLILGGSYTGGNPTFRLFTWNGDPASPPVAATTVLPAPLGSWESIVATPDPIGDGAQVQLIEDDGGVDFYGDGATTEAKALPLGLRKSRIDTFTLALPTQAISFTTTPPVPATFGERYHVAATGGRSGLPVTFSVGGTDSCTVGDATSGTDTDGNGTGAATITLADVGSCTVMATEAGGASYQPAVSVPQSFSVTPATPTVNWPAPDPITYGTGISNAQVNATANVPGTFHYNVSPGDVLTAGPQTLTVTFTPTDSARYTSATASVTLDVHQAAQSINVAAIGNHTFGDAPVLLTANGGGSPSPVTFSTAGPCTVDQTDKGPLLTFTGAGTCTVIANQSGYINYLPASAVSRSVNIAKATPGLTWSSPADITYGTPLSATELDATATVDGTYAYSDDDQAGDASDRVLHAGPHTLHVTFTPVDVTDYTSVTRDVTLTVDKADPQLAWTPAVASLVYGVPLGGNQLDATADVSGSFSYTPPAGTVLHAGTHTLSANFVPDDTTDYTSAGTVTTPLVVDKAPQELSIDPPGQHTFGDTPFTVTATAGHSGNPITFTPVGPCQLASPSSNGDPVRGSVTVTITGAGDCSITAHQDGSEDYLPAPATTTDLTVAKAIPVLTWPTPAHITYGSVLGSGQLGATANVS